MKTKAREQRKNPTPNYINWNASKEEVQAIHKIGLRAVDQGICKDLITLEMDITAAHLNGCRLDLGKLLAAPNFDFAHDVLGIQENIDRNTGKIENFFNPRCYDSGA